LEVARTDYNLCKRHSELSLAAQSRNVTKGANGSKAYQPGDAKYRRIDEVERFG
jgi:hypothetical protein